MRARGDVERRLRGGAFLDSGANSYVTYVAKLDPRMKTQVMTLADGKATTSGSCTGPKGIPSRVVVGRSDTEILPLRWLVERKCKIS